MGKAQKVVKVVTTVQNEQNASKKKPKRSEPVKISPQNGTKKMNLTPYVPTKVKQVKSKLTPLTSATGTSFPKNEETKRKTGASISEEANKRTLENLTLEIRKTISLLFLITKAPHCDILVSPQRGYDSEDAVRALSFVEEKELVEVLTFISSTTMDPLKVSAFCLEEYRVEESQRAWKLKLAANHGDMQTIIQGLEQILAVLRQPEFEAKQATDQVFRCIITMNYNRILCRLQSRHAKWKCNFKTKKEAQPPILPQICTLMRAATPSDPGPSNRIQQLEDLSQSLEEKPIAKDEPPSEGIVTLLGEILTLIYQLHCVSGFSMATWKVSLRKKFTKLVRYLPAANFLANEAKIVDVLRNLKLQIVHLKPFRLTMAGNGVKSLSSFITQHQLVVAPTVVSKEEQFQEVVYQKCPVHAEIQLLFHYELYNAEYPPRVILSTKKPCFLCSVFFRIHGRIYTPPTHRTLWEKWTLPQVLPTLKSPVSSEVTQLITAFLDALLHSVRISLIRKEQNHPSVETLMLGSSIWPQAQYGLRATPTAQRSVEKLPSIPSGSSATVNRSTPSEPDTDGQKTSYLSSSHQSGEFIAASSASSSQETTHPTISSRSPSIARNETQERRRAIGTIDRASLSTSMIANAGTSGSHGLRKGQTLAIPMYPASKGQLPHIRTKKMVLTFEDEARRGAEHASPLNRHGYAVVRNLGARDMSSSNVHGDRKAASSPLLQVVDVLSLPPGKEVVVEQGYADRASGFYLSCGSDLVLVHCN